MAAHIFPLIVKLRFHNAGARQLSGEEEDALASIDFLLAAENVLAAEVEDGEPGGFCWQSAMSEGMREARIARVARELDELSAPQGAAPT